MGAESLVPRIRATAGSLRTLQMTGYADALDGIADEIADLEIFVSPERMHAATELEKIQVICDDAGIPDGGAAESTRVKALCARAQGLEGWAEGAKKFLGEIATSDWGCLDEREPPVYTPCHCDTCAARRLIEDLAEIELSKEEDAS